MTDIEKTKHFSVNRDELCGNLRQYIPPDVTLVEPFVGEGDLLPLFPLHPWEQYDVEEYEGVELRDTLVNPPDYRGKWVVTNPPFLVKNKATDKRLFDRYDEDNLYKIFLRTIMQCEGGILILPTNFFTDERSKNIRKRFFNQFRVIRANFFTEPMFSTTTYTVCSFAFCRKLENKEEKQEVLIGSRLLPLYPEYGFRLGGEVFAELGKVSNIFSRAVEGEKIKGYMTNIKLIALDDRNHRIRLEWTDTPHGGKKADRVEACLVSTVELSTRQQMGIINAFNVRLEKMRQDWGDMILTNYRDFNRKRIGFNFAFHLASGCWQEE